MNEEQQSAWRTRWQRGELAQVDREWRKIGDCLALIATFMADHGDDATNAEIAAFTGRAAALRERCARPETGG